MLEFKLVRFAVSLRNGALVSICDPLGYLHVLPLFHSTGHSIHLSTKLSIYYIEFQWHLHSAVRCEWRLLWSVIGDRWSLIVDRWSVCPFTRSSIISCTLDGALIIVKPSPLTLPGLLGHVCVYAFGRRSFWLRFIMPSATEFVYKHCNF